MTARQLAAFNASFYPTWDQELVKRHFDGFGLPQDKRVSEFSRGMKSQLGLVLAVATSDILHLFLPEISQTAGAEERSNHRVESDG